MSQQVKFYINNKLYKARAGETVLDTALREGIEIPHLCKHPDLGIKANCRVCLVEVEGKGVVTSCSTQVEEGMRVKLDTPKILRARKINLELIFSEHVEKCNRCLYEDNCTILKYARQFDLKIARFFDRKKEYPIWQFGDSIQFDSSKCIDCRNCVEVCNKMQTCSFYEVAERGVETVVKPKGEPGKKADDGVDALKNDLNKFDCSYCGQCVVHCPVGAISGVAHWQAVEKLLENNKDKVLAAQIAPSIRVSLGEEFGQEVGKIMTGQLAASLKALGFDWVFDVNLGADLTTYEEARELVEWLTNHKPRPMFTSCCPAWVKFVEFYYPEFISHLTTTSSPHICSGSVIKTYFANYLKKDPRDMVVVSIMPCTSKKHEINLAAHQIDLGWRLEHLAAKNIKAESQEIPQEVAGVKVPAVDYVLTTREYAYLLHKHKIDLPNLKSQDLDKPLRVHSGAAAIYGASGGVMESALRTADYFLRFLEAGGSLRQIANGQFKVKQIKNSSLQKKRLEFKAVRGMQGIKTAKVKVANKKLQVAVVNELGNARRLLEDLKAGKAAYDYVEVMACPGGCIGGGGQPIPTNAKLRAQRAAALYEIDKHLPIHTAHQNPSVLEFYRQYFKGDKELIERMLHCRYQSAERQGYTEAEQDLATNLKPKT